MALAVLDGLALGAGGAGTVTGAVLSAGVVSCNGATGSTVKVSTVPLGADTSMLVVPS